MLRQTELFHIGNIGIHNNKRDIGVKTSKLEMVANLKKIYLHFIFQIISTNHILKYCTTRA
jgi:hypothetical protein